MYFFFFWLSFNQNIYKYIYANNSNSINNCKWPLVTPPVCFTVNLEEACVQSRRCCSTLHTTPPPLSLTRATKDETKQQPAGKKSSSLWNYFEHTSPKEVKCKLCEKTLVYHNSTSTMRSHLSAKHAKRLQRKTQHSRPLPTSLQGHVVVMTCLFVVCTVNMF
ncbi:hypothetical protein KUCAC02_014778 [Chaenocephalus aceratus]|uniref:Uncharacterized protein n=1 Tax=Chaenocephalus aceratus TaxID=36190 RepID=A0ACB9WET7_CHAAC|nr:hypothetical protein KUCAC02_014778 [Chaenocephalus aceratus]